MDGRNVENILDLNKTALGIDFDSMRIKAVLIGPGHKPIASGKYNSENRFERGIWTYNLEDVCWVDSGLSKWCENVGASDALRPLIK